MAQNAQPSLSLPSGLELRPWCPSDADVLMAAGQDPAIRQWNRLLVETPQDARRRIERMHERCGRSTYVCDVCRVCPAGVGARRGRRGVVSELLWAVCVPEQGSRPCLLGPRCVRWVR